jgi:hypothetical protein
VAAAAEAFDLVSLFMLVSFPFLFGVTTSSDDGCVDLVREADKGVTRMGDACISFHIVGKVDRVTWPVGLLLMQER